MMESQYSNSGAQLLLEKELSGWYYLSFESLKQVSTFSN